jgi:hypothetical protein
MNLTRFIVRSSILILFWFCGANATAQKTPNANGKTSLVHILKDKKGNELGKVYIDYFKNDIFKKLFILKANHGKMDTMYSINNWVFRNPKGIDIKFANENFNGYKIEYLKDDAIQLYGIGNGKTGASDPATIVWNYQKKIFEVYWPPDLTE